MPHIHIFTDYMSNVDIHQLTPTLYLYIYIVGWIQCTWSWLSMIVEAAKVLVVLMVAKSCLGWQPGWPLGWLCWWVFLLAMAEYAKLMRNFPHHLPHNAPLSGFMMNPFSMLMIIVKYTGSIILNPQNHMQKVMVSPLWLLTSFLLIMAGWEAMTVMLAVTTSSPHSWNGSPTTGLGLSLEAGPSVTGV